MADQPVIVVPRLRGAANYLDRCIHFRGMGDHSTCAAGIAYADVTLKHAPPIPYRPGGALRGAVYQKGQSLPCHASLNLGGATCPKRQIMTLAEAEAKEAELAEVLGHIAMARGAIITATGNKGGGGTVPCPKCGGTLHYSQASSNKHVHARCATQGCLSWME